MIYTKKTFSNLSLIFGLICALPGCASTQIHVEKQVNSTEDWQQKVEQIRPGMTETEVRKLLPMSTDFGEGVFQNGELMTRVWYVDANHEVYIVFQGRELPRAKDGRISIDFGLTEGSAWLKKLN